MTREIRIAVTGVAGASGQSVLKALNKINTLREDIQITIFALDVTPISAGLYPKSVYGVVLPKPEENIDAWVNFVEQYDIDMLIPGADRDLLPLAQHAKETRALVSEQRVIDIANDKLATVEFLREHRLPFPKTILPSSPHQSGDWNEFPCVIKPRNDAAARGFHICNDFWDMDYHLERTHDPIIQEYLDGEEYTCTVFADHEGMPVARLVMWRILRDGGTYQAYAVKSPVIDRLLNRICIALKPTGPCNVQLRMVGGIPVPFEINARCSGSTAIRAELGYNEVEMIVDHFLLGLKIEQPRVDYVSYVFRYYNEIVVPMDALETGTGYSGDIGALL